MNDKQNAFKTLRYTCLIAIIVLGFVSIIGTGGSSDSDKGKGAENGTANGNDNDVDNGIVDGDVNGNVHGDSFINSIGMSFNYIEPGTFMMGSPEDEFGRDGFETQHQVTLTQGYYMQTTPVTQGQWEAVMGNNPSGFYFCGDNCPVESVSWYDAQEFIIALTHLEVRRGNISLPHENKLDSDLLDILISVHPRL